VVQPRIHFFDVRGKFFAFDVDTTACVELDEPGMAMLRELSAVGKFDDSRYAHLYPASAFIKCREELERFRKAGYFAGRTSPYRHRKQEGLLAICLHVAHDCNFRCEYCYAHGGSFGRRRRLMSRRTARRAIAFAFEHAEPAGKLNVGFFGGEPLINFDVVRDAVAYAKAESRARGIGVSFGMTTNAALLDGREAGFLAKEGFSLILSLDGPATIHNRMRKDKRGGQTHGRVLKNVRGFSARYGDRFTVRGTFTRTTPNFTEQVLFLNDLGFASVSVEPAQLPSTHRHAISENADLLRVYREYEKLADVYLSRFFSGKPISFFHFDYPLRRLLYPQPIHTQCGAGSGFISVTPDGDIFPCFEMVLESPNRIGTILEGFDSLTREKFQKLHADSKPGCRGCWIKYYCGGGCHAFNIRFNDSELKPYEINCRLTEYRLRLAAYMLSEITAHGKSSINRLKSHLQVGNSSPLHQ
jgi:uncharacterized protein